jgi:hypothetical protein
MTGRHRGDVPDRHRTAARVGDVRGELAEVRDNRIVQIEQALGLRESRRGGREALAERIQQLRPPGSVGRPPPLRHHPPVPHHHQAVHLDVSTLIDRVQEAEHRGRIDPLIRGPLRGRELDMTRAWDTAGPGIMNGPGIAAAFRLSGRSLERTACTCRGRSLAHTGNGSATSP